MLKKVYAHFMCLKLIFNSHMPASRSDVMQANVFDKISYPKCICFKNSWEKY